MADRAQKILIHCYSGMGNFILFLPAFHHYRQTFPNAHFDVVVRREYLRELLESSGYFRSVFIIKPSITHWARNIKTLTSLRRNNYDLSVSVFPTNRLILEALPLLAKAKRNAIFEFNPARTFSLTSRYQIIVRADAGLHDVENNKLLARKVCGSSVDARTDFELPCGGPMFEKGRSESSRIGEGFIVVHPSFNDREPYKGSWDSKRQLFEKLIPELRKKFDTRVVLIAGIDEYIKVRELSESLGPKVSFFCSPSILEAAGFLSNARMLINIDSGLGHVATVLGIPSLTIFGIGNPIRTCPRGRRQHYLKHESSDTPAYGYPFQRSRRYTLSESDQIFSRYSIEDILANVDKVLALK